jgi:aerobic-type carbon monoxide dehydrogenase small subunit (CoxS/CutS family)
MDIQLTLNEAPTSWRILPGETLLEALRRHGCYSVKRGCETGDCGACTVLLAGQPVNSCVVLAGRARGQTVTTLEGLRDDPLLQRLQEAFTEDFAVQCGYCTPGMLISAWVLVREGGRPDEEAVREAMSGNLCRCTGYVKPIQAVLEVWRAEAVS